MNDVQAFGAAAREAMEKDAYLGKFVNYATTRAIPALRGAATTAVEKAAPMVDNVVQKATPYATQAKGVMDDVASRVGGNKFVQGAKDRVVGAARSVGEGVGSVGQFTTNTARNLLNTADDAGRWAMSGPGKAAPAGNKLGDKVVRPIQTEAGRAFGTSPVGDKLNPLNLAVGGGTLYGGARATGLIGSGDEPSAAGINQQTQMASGMQHSMDTQSGQPAGGGGLMGAWNSLPIEARYAIGAGVPLALAGAFMGGRGQGALGGTLGALGLGAAGLGAAGAGMFGDGPRRLVGQGANALYGLAGGGGGDIRSQMNTLRGLSPEFGTTALMGRDPNMSSQQARGMYDFLTNNQDAIERLMPQLQANSTSAVKAGAAFAYKMARCWEGYEPVPGKKPYSNDSCRPVGKKKKKEVKKAGVAGQGKTTMNDTPSSRGSQRLVDDKQRETCCPVPTDATNSQQSSAEKAAFLGKIIGRVAQGAGRAVAGAADNVAQKATGAVAGAADNAAQMAQKAAPMTQGRTVLPSNIQAGKTLQHNRYGSGTVQNVADGMATVQYPGMTRQYRVAPAAAPAGGAQAGAGAARPAAAAAPRPAATAGAAGRPPLPDPPGWNAPYNPAMAGRGGADIPQSLGQRVVGGVSEGASRAYSAGQNIARGLQSAGQAGMNIARGVAPLAQGMVGGAGAVAQGLGSGVNMAGKALSMAAKSPYTAVPTAAAGIYGASQLGGMMPKGMPQLQSPIKWGN
jgi:hypothetical protein